MKKNALDFWVGVFVIVGFAALLFLALKAANLSALSFQPTYDVKLNFDNIGGLKPRAPVKSSGVVVGRVKSIGFDDKAYQAVVILALDKQYQFPKDSSAKILTSGLLGEQYIGLEPGGDAEMLKAGRCGHETGGQHAAGARESGRNASARYVGIAGRHSRGEVNDCPAPSAPWRCGAERGAGGVFDGAYAVADRSA